MLQTIYQERGTQTELEKDTTEEILKAITTLSTKVDSMDKELQKMKNISQQHDYKNVELRRSEDDKIQEIKGDDGKLPKTHNVCLNIAASTNRNVSEKPRNKNLNQLFIKPFTQNTQNIYPQTANFYIRS